LLQKSKIKENERKIGKLRFN